MFAKYALIGLIPVLALGIALAFSMRSEAQARGLSQARDEAALISHTCAISPGTSCGQTTARASTRPRRTRRSTPRTAPWWRA
jgi:hypothetical protein